MIGEKLRDILLDKENLIMSKETELLLYEAARSQIVREVILPALVAGKMVICDRFYDSSTAYQGFGRGLDLEAVQFLNRFATGGLEPDITFFLDISARDARERMNGRESAEDRLEMEGLAFMEAVRRGYLDLAEKNNRIICLDAMRPVNELEREIERTFWEVIQK
jgi:dTMP kinase